MSLLTVNQIAAAGAARKPAFASHAYPALLRYAPLYTDAARHTANVEPCMLAAIVERETGGRNIFQIGMPHSDGCGVGLTQITYGVDWTHPDAPTYSGYSESLLDPLTNLTVAAVVFLQPLLAEFAGSHLDAFAGFNEGDSAVRRALARGVDPDSTTTGGDYGISVFRSWINFTADALGVNVDWASYRR